MTLLRHRVLRAVEDDPGLLRSAYDQVLRPSFSEDELPHHDTLVAGFLEGEQRIVVALDDGGVPVAAAVTGHGAGAPLGLLSYLAVRPGARGQGVGGAVMRQLADVWGAMPVRAVLAEVHDPRVHAEEPDEHPRDRLRFYRSHGAKLLDLPWVQPALAASTRPVAGMLLLVVHLAPGADVGSVPAADVSVWVEDYYAGCGSRPPARLSQLLSGRDECRILDVDDLEHVPPLT